MIRKYVYGNPLNTEAVCAEIEECNEEIAYFEVNNTEFIYSFSDEDIVFGLGEQVRGINKRGWKYVSWNYDNPHHQEDTNSLYGSHNFLIIRGKETFGVFFDNPGEVVFDIGYTNRDLMIISPEYPDQVVYIIDGENENDIVRQFRSIIGKSYVPPFWAFGYGQSRWGYMNEADIREVHDKYREVGIPLDSIYLDIDYMDNYKDFTVNDSGFNDLKSFAFEMKEDNVHLVPIIDAGVKIEEGYDIYEEGVENSYFCKDSLNNDFTGAVWPGKVHFPDFLNKDAREWFGMKYKTLTDLGIDGFWNDMNEPAIFYTEDSLKEAVNNMEKVKDSNIGIIEFFKLTGAFAGLNGNRDSYRKFFHNFNGEVVRHDRVHNLYGMNMTRSAYEALCKIEPEKRTLFFSRSSYIGAHRYGGIWQGDNKSWWSHILQSMQQLPALNMAGFLYVGCDTAGFGSDTTEDLVLRWLQYSIFTPLFRNHSANGTRYQELYRFSNVDSCKKMIEIRYSIVAYIYSEFLKAVENDSLMFKPLAFEFPDDKAALNVDDQLLIGNESMICPIYKQNAKGRYVYLPEEMMLVKMKSYNEYDTAVMEKGHHYVDASLDELVFFIRKGKSIPFGKPADSTANLDSASLFLLGYEGSSYTLYKDDGISHYDENSVIKVLMNK